MYIYIYACWMSFFSYFDIWYFLNYTVVMFLVLGYLHIVGNQKMSAHLDGFYDCNSVYYQDYVYDRVQSGVIIFIKKSCCTTCRVKQILMHINTTVDMRIENEAALWVIT